MAPVMIGTPVLIAVEFAGISQHTAAWHLLNGEELLQPHPDRGENIVLPGFDGRLGQPFHDDEMEVTLRYLFDGNADSEGAAHSNPVNGLAENKRDFYDSVYRANRDQYGTVSCTATDVDGTAYEGRIQLRRLRWGEGDLTHCPATLTAVVVAPLTATGS